MFVFLVMVGGGGLEPPCGILDLQSSAVAAVPPTHIVIRCQFTSPVLVQPAVTTPVAATVITATTVEPSTIVVRLPPFLA
jgi:hypothetical protein